MTHHEHEHDHTHSVMPGTSGGMGGSGEEQERDDEAARAFIERQDDPHASDGIDVHEAGAGQDLGWDERSEPL